MRNKLCTLSFDYRNTGYDIDDMHDKLYDLIEVISYCSDINEPMQFDMDLWNCIVDNKGKTMANWIYEDSHRTPEDLKRFYLEFFSKSSKREDGGGIIQCGLGRYGNVATTVEEYLDKRRSFLDSLNDKEEYYKLLRTCFANLMFSLECEDGFRRIGKFGEVKKEIVSVLVALDSKANKLYKECKNDGSEAEKRLTSMIGRTCSPDPRNKEKLEFSFAKGSDVVKVCCHIHMKLLRDDSNCRIYFWWNDENVERKGKTLIGWIDGHPY